MLAPNFLIDDFGGSVNNVGDYQKHFDYSDMRKTQKFPSKLFGILTMRR